MAKNKLSKGKKGALVAAIISIALGLALIITNFFIPVKYLTSYLVKRNKGAQNGVMRVRFVDVGYGDCTIIELPDGKNMLIDGGNGSSSNVARILKFLNKCDIDTIDYLVCTSVNAEHCGGLSEIIRYKSVKTIYMPYCINTYITNEYRSFAVAANSCNAELLISEYGAGVSNADYGYFFTFLSPSVHTNADGQYAALNADPTSVEARNGASAVIWLEYAGTSFLFTSDANTAALSNICKSYVNTDGGYSIDLTSLDVITVAGHAGESSVCAEIYELTSPEIAVLSTGNGVKCSDAAVNDAVLCVGEKLYRTDEYGTVTIEVTCDNYAVV